MFLDPEGGDARVDRYVPPPPPPAPPPPPKVSTFQGQVNTDTTQYQRDSSALGAARGNLATALRNAAQNNYGSVATAKNGPGGASTAVATLTSQVTALQGRVTADQRALATAKAHLAAAKAAQSAATHYKPKPLPVTVSNPTTRAVTRAVNTALQGLKPTQTADQGKVNADQSAIAGTQAQINAAGQGDVPSRGGIQHLLALGRQLARQQAQLKADQAGLQKINYHIDAVTTAGRVAIGVEQTNADQSSATAQYTKLVKTGVLKPDGSLAVPVTKLTPAQLVAYDKFVAAMLQVKGDNSALAQGEDDLQIDQSKYGFATGAVGLVNHALAPFGWQLNTPPAIAVHIARADLRAANQAANQADATWNVATAMTAAATADQQLAKLLNQHPRNFAQLLPQYELAATQASAAYDQSSAYLQRLGDQQTLKTEQQALTQATAAYDAHPTAVTALALETAQEHVYQGEQHLQIDGANFLTASSEVSSASQLAAVATTNVTVSTDTKALTQQENTGTACVAPDPTLVKALSGAQAAAARAQAAAAAPTLVTQNLGAYATLLGADFNDWQATAAAAGIPGASSTLTAGEAYIQQQEALLGYSQTSFEVTLPPNLLNPQSNADAATAQSDWEQYVNQHHLRLSDPAIAQALAQTKPGQRVNTAAAIKEIKADLATARQTRADRPLLQLGWDWLSGAGGSATQSYLEGELHELQSLNPHQSVSAYNLQFMQDVGGLSTRFNGMNQSDLADEQNWSTAEKTVETVAVAAVDMAVTVATAGAGGAVVGVLMGAEAGFLAQQGFRAGGDIATLAQGGTLQKDPFNTGASLLTVATNNFGHGGVTRQEGIGSLVAASTDAITAVATSTGTEAGSVVSKAVGAALQAPVDATADAAVATAEGTAAAGAEGTAAGTESTAAAAEGTATGAAAEETPAAGEKLPWRISVPANIAGYATSQAFMGTGQVLSTTGSALYAQSQGQITGAQARQQITAAIGGALFNLATAPIVGGISGITSHNPLIQFGVNGATNAGLTLGSNAISGQGFSASDWTSVFLNTLSATVQDAIGARAERSLSSNEPLIPDDTLPTTGDSWDVNNRFAAQNGAPLPDQPLFGDSKQDRRLIAATAASLATTGYGSGVIDGVVQTLRGLPAPEGRELGVQIQALDGSEHQRVMWLSHELASLQGGALEPTGAQADAISAHMLTILADLTPTERTTIFKNAAAVFAGPASPRYALATYLTATPGEHTAAINTAESLLILSQPASARSDVIAALTAARNGEGTGGSGTQAAQINTLVTASLQTDTPIRLTDLGERSMVPDRLSTVIEGAPIFPVRQQPSRSDFVAAGRALRDQMLARYAQNQASGEDTPFVLMLTTGSPAVEGSGSQLSAYGPEGTAAFISGMRQLASGIGVRLDVVVVTSDDARGTPAVLDATHEAAGIPSGEVTYVADDGNNRTLRTILSRNPDAFVSIGRRFGFYGRRLFEAAGNRPDTTTYAIVDGTSDSAQQPVFLTAEHRLVAANVLLGAHTLADVALNEAGVAERSVTPDMLRAIMQAARTAGATHDDARFVPGAAPGTLTDDTHVSNWYRVGDALQATGLPAMAPRTWREQYAASFARTALLADPAAATAALADYGDLSDLALPSKDPLDSDALSRAVSSRSVEVAAPRRSVRTEVRRGDSWGAASNIAVQNGYSLTDLPRFGVSGQDRRALQAARAALANAHFNTHVIDQLSGYLTGLSTYEGRTIAAGIAGVTVRGTEGLTPADLNQIRALGGKLPPGYDGALDAQLLAAFTRLPGETRTQLLTRGQSLMADPAQYSAFRDYLRGAGQRSATTNAADTAFLMWLAPTDRSEAMDLLASLHGTQTGSTSSQTLSADQRAQADALFAIAQRNGVPKQLVAGLDGPTALNLLEWAGTGAAHFGSPGQYPGFDPAAAGTALYTQVVAQHEANAQSGSKEPLRLMIGVGGVELLDAAGRPQASAYGPAGAVELAYNTKQLADKNNPIEVTLVADNDVTARAIDYAYLGLKSRKPGFEIEQRLALGSTSPEDVLSRNRPDAFVAIGPSDLLPQAISRDGTTTYVVSDGTAEGSASSSLPSADYTLMAPDLNVGAALLSGHTLRAADTVFNMLNPRDAVPVLSWPLTGPQIQGAPQEGVAVFDDSRFITGAEPTTTLEAHIGNRYSLADAFREYPLATESERGPQMSWSDYLAAKYAHDVASTGGAEALKAWSDVMALARRPSTWMDKVRLRADEFSMSSTREKRLIVGGAGAYATSMGLMLGSYFFPGALPRVFGPLVTASVLPERSQSWYRMYIWASGRYPGDSASVSQRDRFLAVADANRAGGILTDMLVLFAGTHTDPWSTLWGGSLDLGHALIGGGVAIWYREIAQQVLNVKLGLDGKFRKDPFAERSLPFWSKALPKSLRTRGIDPAIFLGGSIAVLLGDSLHEPPDVFEKIFSNMAEGGWGFVNGTELLDEFGLQEWEPKQRWLQKAWNPVKSVWKPIQVITSVIAHTGTGGQSITDGILGALGESTSDVSTAPDNPSPR